MTLTVFFVPVGMETDFKKEFNQNSPAVANSIDLAGDGPQVLANISHFPCFRNKNPAVLLKLNKK